MKSLPVGQRGAARRRQYNPASPLPAIDRHQSICHVGCAANERNDPTTVCEAATVAQRAMAIGDRRR
jgi:hypothetical protein